MTSFEQQPSSLTDGAATQVRTTDAAAQSRNAQVRNALDEGDEARDSSSRSTPTVVFSGTREDYPGWSAQMRAVLFCKNLWEVVEKAAQGGGGRSSSSVIGGDDVEFN